MLLHECVQTYDIVTVSLGVYGTSCDLVCGSICNIDRSILVETPHLLLIFLFSLLPGAQGDKSLGRLGPFNGREAYAPQSSVMQILLCGCCHLC